MRRFTGQRAVVYDLYRTTLAVPRGGGLASAYRLGRLTDHPPRFVRSSLAYAAWAAGRDRRLDHQEILVAEQYWRDK